MAMKSSRFDIVVVGAGIIGCMGAWRLARQGWSVALIDAGEPGGQASNAAAGILSPSAEVQAPGPFWDLAQASLHRYPAMVAELEADSGMTVDFQQSGVLAVADAEHASALVARERWQSAAGADLQWLDANSLTQVEPALSGTGFAAVLYAPHEAQVNAPKMVQAAVRAGQFRGVTFIGGNPVERLNRGPNGRVVGACLADRVVEAERGVILAAGAWTGLLARTLGLELPVEPIRGQVLGLNADHRILRHVVFMGTQYACPKPDGRVIVGATEDRAGYDRRPTARGLAVLSGILERLHLAELPFLFDRAWAGLRPKTPDTLPILGSWPGIEGLAVASGHYRNGVLLSVITASWMEAWATGSGATAQWRAFSPERWLPRAATEPQAQSQ